MGWLDDYIKQQSSAPSEYDVNPSILQALTNPGHKPTPKQSGLLEKLLQTWPARMAQSAVSAAALPGDVYAGRTNPMSQDAINRAADLGGTVMGSVFGIAPKGSVGIFGGRLSKTADQNALKQAETMAANGVAREEIWNKTGWFQGVDGKWRYEIPDNASKLNPDAYAMPAIFQHDQLYQAYPRIAFDKAGVDVTPIGPVGGYMARSEIDGVPGPRELFVRARTPQQARTMMAHEVQHRVQDIEGFAQGANYKEWGPEKYHRSAGENEAKAVMRRIHLTPEELKARPPWLDYSVPEQDQILDLLLKK